MKKAAAPKKENYKSKIWLTKRYQTDGKTVTAIANECGVSYQTVYNWLVRFELIRNGRSWK
jgi:transposase